MIKSAVEIVQYITTPIALMWFLFISMDEYLANKNTTTLVFMCLWGFFFLLYMWSIMPNKRTKQEVKK